MRRSVSTLAVKLALTVALILSGAAVPASAFAVDVDFNRIVWVSKTGSKYHYRVNCSDMRNPMQMTLGGALAMGRTACKVCVDDTSGKPSEPEVNHGPFADVSSSTPHADDILWLASSGISEGWLESDGTRTFRGMDTVKRQDMAAFLYRLAGKPTFVPSEADKSRFTDVNDRTPHAKEIWWLASNGITTGFEDRTFRGMDTVKRQDMAAFLFRLSGSPSFKPSAVDEGRFIDVNDNTPHAKNIWWLASTGISEGWKLPDGRYEYRGMSDVVRQDMAAFLHRMDIGGYVK